MSNNSEAAGFQHGTSSSSRMKLEKCDECEEDPHSDAAVFCGKCELQLCTLCDADKHKGRKTSLHYRISIVERRVELEAMKIYNRMLSNSPSLRHGQVDADLKNKFCYFCPNERRIIFMPRLAELVQDPKARPSLVSLIGPTGVGKSFLLKYLLLVDGVERDMDMPLIGAAGDPQSTSADIHIYAGRQDSAHPLLYLDSEGRGGSKKPHGVSSLLEAIMRAKSADGGSYVDVRYEHVQTSYPRMLYIFSDVLCFVFSGNWREKLNILGPLLEWGKTASFGADNQHRPQLIIIFNKTDKETFHDDFDNFKKTFEKWIADDEQGDELLLYYSNPLAVSVPHMDFDGADKKVPSRVAKLREAIMESTQRIRTERSEGKLLFTRCQLELYMRKVAGIFSKYPTAVFDIYKAMFTDSLVVGLTGYNVELRWEGGIPPGLLDER
ncbi:hypothetical protein KC19_1G120100 [Ceratodon purpureus]|uniref:B box-type domain-containing protein n=1 Tax=Ceratodon purpureus TaxID=3225 RepID=A0A8T0J430_CERPU|nr:hypothetical protein KC19_1G120100 [Ceratodon purpureus]